MSVLPWKWRVRTCFLATSRSRMLGCSTRPDTPKTAFDMRRLSEQRSPDKIFAQCAISLTASVGARHQEVSFTEQARDERSDVADAWTVHCIRALRYTMHVGPHVLHQVSTSAQEFQCHVGRVSSCGCGKSSRMQNETERVCLRVRAEKLRAFLLERDQVELVYWSRVGV